MKKILITITALFLTSISFAESIQCKVVGVNDGDTITCLTDEKKEIIFGLLDVSAPKLDQPYGEEAKQILSNLILNKYIFVTWYFKDEFNRPLGKIYFNSCVYPNTNPSCPRRLVVTIDVNLEMLKLGYAWHSQHLYTGWAQSNIEAVQEAKKAKRGLWADPNPTPPWEWRTQKRSK